MNKDTKNIFKVLSRYLILILIVLPGLVLFYDVFLPLTKYPVLFFFELFFKNVSLSGNSIVVGKKVLDIIGACVGGSAYYLFLILNLSTPKIEAVKRIRMIVIAFLSFLIVNIIRIILLGVIYIHNSPYFGVTHEILWYFGSTILVVGVWFYEVKKFNIKKIPFYSDIKGFYSKSLLNPKKSRR